MCIVVIIVVKDVKNIYILWTLNEYKTGLKGGKEVIEMSNYSAFPYTRLHTLLISLLHLPFLNLIDP